jgi:acyl-CoA reductase-like NAD-dependent aldehyde dehydrogenase
MGARSSRREAIGRAPHRRGGAMKGLYVAGMWRDSADRLAVMHKHTGAVLDEVAVATPQDVDLAVGAARDAAEHPLGPAQRSRILGAVAEAVRGEADGLAALIAQEGGKPRKDAQAEVARAVETLTLSAMEARRIGGEVVPIEGSPGGEDRLAFSLRVPVGVVAAITPFNFPLNLVCHKVGPAIAAGNAVVLKPASATPLSAVRLVELFEAAGLPPGFLNLVVGPGATVGEALCDHPGIDLYTFTGSPPVGRRIKERTGLRRVLLELGNNSPNIVCADADLERAAEILARRGFGSAGQSCISVQRIYVEREVFEPFLDHLLEQTGRLKVGDPEDPETDIGPMISEAEARRAESWIREAVDAGARVLLGGDRQGAVLSPTVLVDVTPEMRVVCEEVFAPVVTVTPVDSLDEAIEASNDSAYGLQAGIFTASLGHAVVAARRLRFGGVIVNDASAFRADVMPYGGVRGSGAGREGPRYAVEEMTEVRVVVIRP